MSAIERERFAEAMWTLLELVEREADAEAASEVAAFLHDAPGFYERYAPSMELTPYQLDVLSNFYERKRVAVISPHGVGKTRTQACLIVHFAITREAAAISWVAPSTASRDRQLKEQLWPEIRNVLRQLDWAALADDGFETWRVGRQIQDQHLIGTYGRAYAAVSRHESGIEGAHADHVLYAFDESKAVPDAVFDAAEGALVGEGVEGLEAYALASSTPGHPSGRFYSITNADPRFADWWTRRVTKEEAIEAGRISRAWVDARARSWGTDTALYQNRVEGRYYPEDEESLVKLAWLERAVEYWHELKAQGLIVDIERPKPFSCTGGVDVAAHGGDRTVIARVHKGTGPNGLEFRWLDLTSEDYTPDVVELAHTAARRLGPHNLCTIDSDGMGLGTSHEYKSLHTKFPDRYDVPHEHFSFLGGQGVPDWRDVSGEVQAMNRRSAAWWELRQALQPELDDIRPRLALPPHDELAGDVTAPRWDWSGGKIRVEKKEKTKERVHRSPDFGDGLVLALWREPVKGGVTVPGLNDLLQRALQ